MSNLNKIDFRHSFATKVSLWMLVTTAAVFVISFGTALWFAGASILSDGHHKANLELDKAVLFLTNEMTAVETAGNNLAASWDKDKRVDPDEVYAICRNFIKHNRHIQGVCIAFSPEVYPEYPKGFAPYFMMTQNGKSIECNLVDRYEIYNLEWYARTVKTRKCWWTNPYKESNGTIISIYCIPIIASNGKVIGVFAIDMSLKQLSERVEKIKPYPKSFITVLDRDLNFVVHPDKNLILKGNPMKILDRRKYEVNETIYVDIKNHKRGIGLFGEKGNKKYLYYAPVSRTGWTVTLECDRAEITAGVATIRRQMLLISILGMVGLMFVCMILMRKFLRPIRLYSTAALKIAEGDFHTVLPHMRDHNELWALGNSLDYMQQSLDRYVNELTVTTREKGRIESELNIASKIQMSMIPKIFPPYPDRDDIDIYGSLIPAKAVGGDLYDFFLRDEKFFFCVGDVSGKGVPASLVMAVTRSLLRIVASQESRPERIVASLNDSMSDMNDSNMFVTLFVGVLDLPTGRFRYCNAGHNAPVVIDGVDGSVRMLDVKPNLPIAIMPDMKFEMQETVISPETSLFMYTDGLTEAENKEKALFGEERMISELEKTKAKSSKEQIENMLDAIHAYVDGAEQSDDLTMIAVKYKRKQRDTKFYRKITLHNDIRETPKIADFMDDIVGETGIDLGLASSLNLALEEAVVNVMNYAYPAGQAGNIVLEAYANDERLKFVISDNGVPFDPTTTAEPDVTASLENRAVGGLGIFLVRHLMDSVNYERVENENVLTLRKMLNQSKS